MAGQFLPPPERASTLSPDVTPQQSVAIWADLMDLCEEFLLATLREEVGPEGDLREAYRRWYEARMEDHHQHIAHMLAELGRREAGHVI